jgi:hypothetical protein
MENEKRLLVKYYDVNYSFILLYSNCMYLELPFSFDNLFLFAHRYKLLRKVSYLRAGGLVCFVH